MRLSMMILPALLAGCATTAADDSTAAPGGPCKNDNLQQFVGQVVSPELGAAALKESGARTLRWGPPGSAMTMDFRPDRLTISYDEASKVTTISCG